jgi:dipeptidyl aminopeptidase/acylaminoacyl peptidase
MPRLSCALLTLGLFSAAEATEARPLASADYRRMRSVAEARISPDAARIAYTVSTNDGPGRPRKQLFVMTVADRRVARVGGDETASDPEWSPDGSWLAWSDTVGGKKGLIVAHPDGSGLRFLGEITGTNSPLTFEGRRIAWSPDATRIAFVSATPGPETELASGDPVVITRYLYKPDADEGMTRFNDNRRRHIFVADLATGAVSQLTRGDREQHSIDWSPDGREIAYVSSAEPDPDLFYNPDLFAIRVADGAVRRLTATESAEYQPRWSPDGRSLAFLGTRRGLTDLETTMEDTHVWLMAADGSGRRELGAAVDNRQGAASWAPDNRSIYCTVQERGHVRLVELPLVGSPVIVVSTDGRVGDYSVSSSGSLAYTFTSRSDLAQLYVADLPRRIIAGARRGAAAVAPRPPRRLTDLNAEVLRDVETAAVESLSFVSNDFKFEVEAFLTRPVGLTPESKVPLVVMIHGGPHGQQGPQYNFKSQFYAHRGYATLQVNYRGSTGYGQKFADAVFGDQNGNEAQDVLYGVSAALRRNPWLDADRVVVEGTSYGGQLSAWLVTQTHIFKAAIPLAGITNNLSYNYMTYYNMYEQMEWGVLPHQGKLMDVLWERSALKYVAQVKTPTMLVHGENDNDVPIAESEQFYIALKDVGVETVLVRYPREGHGLAEPGHIVDLMDRSLAFYEKQFARAGR